MNRTNNSTPPIMAVVLILGTLAFAVLMLVVWIYYNFTYTPDPTAIALAPTFTPTETPFHPVIATVTSTETATSKPTPTPTSTPTDVPQPTNTEVPTSMPDLLPTSDTWVSDKLSQMTLDQKLGQMIMTGVDGQAGNSATCQFIQGLSPGAVIYRISNVNSPDQLRDFSISLRDCANSGQLIPFWIAVDHEGQYVTRFNTGVTVFPAALAQGATGDPKTAYDIAYAGGQELAYSGVNMVLGPVADVLTDYDNTVISQRSFGGDASQVKEFITQAVLGYQQAGLTPVLKHYPGHGGVSADSHYDQPIDNVDVTGLFEYYLPPFVGGIIAGAPVVMTSHVAFPMLDSSGNPATLSDPTVNLLRDNLEFSGIFLTDSMGMGAITGRGLTIAEASVQAVRAGVDMLMITSPPNAVETKDRLAIAVQQGEIPVERIDEAVKRILSVKYSVGLSEFKPVESTSPDWGANSQLAFLSGYSSVAKIKDETKLVPIPPELNNILIIGPLDGWGLYPVLTTALQENDFTTQVVQYSGPWDGDVREREYLQNLPLQAEQYELVIILTWDSHLKQFPWRKSPSGDRFQIDLVNALLATGRPIIVVALKSPTDILDFPQVSTYLATYGTTPGQLQALADALVNRSSLEGVNPLPGLPVE